MKDQFIENMIRATIDNGGMTEREKDFFKAKARKLWESSKLTDEEVNNIFYIINHIVKTLKEVA